MNNNPQTESRERKRAEFTNKQGPTRNVTAILVSVVVVLLGVAAYLVVTSTNQQPKATALTQGPTSSGGSGHDIRIAVADLGDGRAKFFDYRTPDNKQLRFFVMKSSDGVLRAALDACDTCYHAKKGYHQEGDNMVCNNCGLKFPSALINEAKGGCNPVGLPRAIDGDQVVIKAGDLDSRSNYF
ncbi:MAG TPA: DUF2318 domain-containing protein [Blastocatellia bacterium]|jgi:uncharacterized membrane protein|nr:DUF2318 domain-containing protein [Blastocatellia bacterium]